MSIQMSELEWLCTLLLNLFLKSDNLFVLCKFEYFTTFETNCPKLDSNRLVLNLKKKQLRFQLVLILPTFGLTFCGLYGKIVIQGELGRWG
jgi:hypothetical protein